MADDSTDKTLDRLAELFLTEAGTSPTGHASPDDSPARRRRAAVEPMRIAPKPVAIHGRQQTAGDEADVPADESDDARHADVAGTIGVATDDERPQAPPRANHHLVEAVFLGHLPGYSGPWLTQYANHLARRRGPVAIVHVEDEQIEVEFVADRQQPRAEMQPDTIGPGGPDAVDDAEQAGEQLLDCLHDLSQLSPAPVMSWLIHLPLPLSPAALARARELPRWTLLSGVDDAAVVSAYRLLKQLLDDDLHAAERRVGVMIMGGEDRAARIAARKLSDACSRFYETPVGLLGGLRQMVPVRQRVIGRFAAPDDVWPSIRALIETLPAKLLGGEDDDEAELRRELDLIGEPQGDIGLQSMDEEGGGPLTEDTAPPPPETALPPAEMSPQTADASPTAPQVSRPVQEATPAAAPSDSQVHEAAAGAGEQDLSQNESDAQSAAPAATNEDVDLTRFVAGALRLDARCPMHPESQLALDEQGRVHLMSHCPVSQRPGSAVDDTEARLRHAIVDLLEVRAWAQQHLELIGQTQRQCRFDARAVPRLHLFTDHAKAAARLASAAQSLLEVHLLQHIKVGADHTWYCNDLT